MIVCEYGCGQTANYQLKNGKWCCENHYRRCIYMRKINKGRVHSIESINKMKGRKVSEETKQKLREINTGNILSEETKKKISNSCKGKIRSLEIRNKMKGRKVSEETKIKISKSNKGRIITEDHRNKIKKARTLQILNPVSKLTKQKISNTLKYKLKDYKVKYPAFCKVEELREDPLTKEIQCHCKYNKCPNSKENNGWFTPDKEALKRRAYEIENENGKDGSYLYCSQKCKDECTLFRLNPRYINLNNNLKNINYTQTEKQILNIHVLERDNNKCLYCGENAEHVHHIKPIKLEPFFSLDPENCISVCSKCHYKYGHKEDCSTGKLANKVCTK